MGKKKLKSMPVDDFKVVLDAKWNAVRLEPESWPGWLRNIPPEKVKLVIASGDAAPGTPHFTEKDLANAKFEIGGIDVYRHAEPKDGVKLNKDWYSVVYDPSTPSKFAVVGPIKNSEHW